MTKLDNNDPIKKAHGKSVRMLKSEIEEFADSIRVHTWPKDGELDLYPTIVEFGKKQFALGQLTTIEPVAGGGSNDGVNPKED